MSAISRRSRDISTVAIIWGYNSNVGRQDKAGYPFEVGNTSVPRFVDEVAW